MIRNYLYFEYAGIDSRDFDIANVNVSSGMLDEPFVGNISLLEHKVRGKDKPYFKRKERNPLSFTVSFAFTDTFNDVKIRQVANWLTRHEYYQPLSFIPDDVAEYEKKIFYALVVEDSRIIHNGLGDGYLDLTFRCDSAWGYLETESTELLTFTGNDNPLALTNNGDLDLYPVIEIEKINSPGALVIENTTNNIKSEFYNKASGTGYIKVNGTVYDGETIQIGDEVYEFDTGDGVVEDGNILVDVSATAEFAGSRLTFVENIKDKDSISIGKDTYEFSIDDNHRVQNIKIDISEEVSDATGTLTFTGVPKPLDTVFIGNTRYVFDRSTTEGVIKITRHGVEGGSGIFCVVNRILPDNIYFVRSIDTNFLEVVSYTKNNPFDNPRPVNSATIPNQKQGDIIEIYNGKMRHAVANGTTNSVIITSDTYGLRTGDLVGALMSNGSIEFKKVASVTQNSRITLVSALSGTPTHFYAFSRVGLRSAEGAALETPYVVTIGATPAQTAMNLKKAINLDGIAIIDYGVGMIQNQLVEATINVENINQILLVSKFPGSEGNQIATNTSDSFPGLFGASTLVGGQDCAIATAITKLVAAVNANTTSEVTVSASTATYIDFLAKIAGTNGNGLLGLANNTNVVWVNENFEGGKDPNPLTVLNALNNKITAFSQIVVSFAQSTEILLITHKRQGTDTNISFKSNSINIFPSGSHLINGRSELLEGENIIIDTEKQSVISDITPRYDTYNHKYIKLVSGVNNLLISGDCKIKFIMTPRIY